MTDNGDEGRIHRGLKGVYFERSPTTFIDGRAGDLRYRGYSIHDLARHSTFEETSYLLLRGELPTQSQLDGFDKELKAARKLPDEILDLIATVKAAHPMDVLRTAVSALAAFDEDAEDKSPEATLRKGIRLTSQVPMIVTAHHHIRGGGDPVAPDMDLSHAANFLHMLKGEAPSDDAAGLMDMDFVLHAEHGSNASSFTARVVIGTEATLHAAATEHFYIVRLVLVLYALFPGLLLFHFDQECVQFVFRRPGVWRGVRACGHIGNQLLHHRLPLTTEPRIRGVFGVCLAVARQSCTDTLQDFVGGL